jgi:hypothetical protein
MFTECIICSNRARIQLQTISSVPNHTSCYWQLIVYKKLRLILVCMHVLVVSTISAVCIVCKLSLNYKKRVRKSDGQTSEKNVDRLSSSSKVVLKKKNLMMYLTNSPEIFRAYSCIRAVLNENIYISVSCVEYILLEKLLSKKPMLNLYLCCDH